MATTSLTEKASPITAESLSLSGLAFSDAQSLPDGRLFVRCTDPAKLGKSCVLSIIAHSHAAASSAEEPQVHTPEEHNVRSAVHEYGGGAFAVFADGSLVYTDFPSHKVYKTTSTSSSTNAAPSIDSSVLVFPIQEKHAACRLADFCVIQDANQVVVAIMEDHTDPSPAKVVNSLVALHLDGSGRVETVAAGMDFYSAPAYNPVTQQLAFIGWNHPNMPWDDTALYVITLDKEQGFAPKNNKNNTQPPTLIHGREVATGHDETTSSATISVYSPKWHAKTGHLLFLSDVSGWYNLYKWNGNETTPLCQKEADMTEAYSGWQLGLHCVDCFLDNGTVVTKYNDPEQGTMVLFMDPETGAISEFGRSTLPPTSISSLCCAGDSLYFLGGGVKEPVAIWCWNGAGNDASSQARRVLSSLKVDTLLEQISPFMSIPRVITAKSEGQVGTGECYAIYYPPNNLSSSLPKNDFAPPMLVKAHGGPTATTSTTFRLDIQFWTSRGFAVLDVNYGGSTGYGKTYRQSLYGNWGVLDVQDVVAAAQHCIDEGMARAEWVCIDGRSAGGYTTLAALTFSNLFRAGASLYGIGDLAKLVEETHKFESRYTDRLIGPYPAAKATYDERCPILHTDQLNAPMILLQGDEDKVVPPNQAVDMFEISKQKGIPAALVMYKGEQHGFRKAANMKHALLSEYCFFCNVFDIEPQQETDFDGVRMNERVDIDL